MLLSDTLVVSALVEAAWARNSASRLRRTPGADSACRSDGCSSPVASACILSWIVEVSPPRSRGSTRRSRRFYVRSTPNCLRRSGAVAVHDVKEPAGNEALEAALDLPI